MQGETVARLRAPLVEDDYKNQVRNWDAANSTPITGCGVAQAGTFDIGVPDRAAVEADYQVFMAAATDVIETDRLTIRGEVCEIVGKPFDWKNPLTGWAPGLAVLARVRKG